MNNFKHKIVKKITHYKKLIGGEWGSKVDEINESPYLMDKVTVVINEAIENNLFSIELIEIMVNVLEHNNIIFYKDANYKQYQQVASQLLDILFIKKISLPYNFLIYCLSVLVYSDEIYGEPYKDIYKATLLDGVERCHLIDKNKMFLILIHISQYYLFTGSITKSRNKLLKAKNMRNEIENKNYILFFYYHFSWSFVEEGNYHLAKKEVEVLVNMQVNHNTPIFLQSLNIQAKIFLKLGSIAEAEEIAQECYIVAKKTFGKANCGVIAETLLTIGKCQLEKDNLIQAEETIKHSISLLNRLFGGEKIDPSQSVAKVIFADLLIKRGLYQEALYEYQEAKQLYIKFYGKSLENMKEAQELEEKINQINKI